MIAVLQEIISIIVGGISGIAEGVGSGLQTLVTSVFLESGAEGALTLSTMGGLICVFAGIALAIGLCRWVVNWVTSLGN